MCLVCVSGPEGDFPSPKRAEAKHLRDHELHEFVESFYVSLLTAYETARRFAAPAS